VWTLSWIRKPKSRVVQTPGGIESWAEQGGVPFVARVARISCLRERMEALGVRVERRWASEFCDPYRFPGGRLRDTAIHLNLFSFGVSLPACLSMGNIILGQKK